MNKNKIYIDKKFGIFFLGHIQLTGLNIEACVDKPTTITMTMCYNNEDVIHCDSIEEIKAGLL